jgi:nucleoside-diphosphate-sugar epimerase
MQIILGAGSPVSRELAKALKKYTDEIKLVSRNPVKVNDSDLLMKADLNDKNLLDDAVKGAEIVYVTIGFQYKTSVWKKQWPAFMSSLINACKKYNSKIVFLDNMYLYTPYHLSHMTEETPAAPSSEKGKIRMDVYKMLMDAAANGEVKAITARAADFYGPGVNTSALAQSVYNNLLKDKNPRWIGRLDVIHSFTYSRDIGEAMAILGNTPDAYNRVWHLPTTSEKLTTRQWIEMFMKEMNKNKNIQTVSYRGMNLLGLFIPVLKELKDIYYQFDRDYFFDSSRFNKQFNFTPTSPEKGVKEIVHGK